VIEQVINAAGVLGDFNTAGVLAAVDVHAARVMGRVCGEDDPRVLLAAALAVRAPRFGHVCVDLATVHDTVTVDEDAEVDLEELPWPDPASWLEAVAASALLGPDRPLYLEGARLYLERYWTAERQVGSFLLARAAEPAIDLNEVVLARALDEQFGSAPDLQRAGAEMAVRRRLAVLAGGPGTGKTYTIRRILDVLNAQADAAGVARPRVALAAPTGKAAARLTESLGGDQEASTIHRLLRTHPGNRTRFRHDSRSPLPHDVVVVDETSMVSLTLMAKLLDAVAPQTRVILVGDPDQLVSVEAGAVLGDVVGPANEQRDATGPLAGTITVLERVRRFSETSGIAELARAVQRGRADDTLDILASDRPDVHWIELDARDEVAVAASLDPVRAAVRDAGRTIHAAATAGAGEEALAAVESLRVLCAHRRGAYGLASWLPRIERWLAADVAGFNPAEPWYLGRPVIVTQNDYQLGVYNGDVGVTVADDERRVVVFPRAGGGVRPLSPSRLEAVETVHAMTIHKSQGSQFRTAVVVLPDETSPILTRELLYTAVTRAEEAVTIVGTAAAVRAAVQRRVRRASGLAERLWPAT
jgi:exodeoxyribonuclease V alpha subunit